jgi:Family of unknown function (DUF6356)
LGEIFGYGDTYSLHPLERKQAMPTLSKLFIAHPAAVGESYLKHMKFAFRFSGRLFRAGFAAFAHGFVPAVCETTASQAILSMNDEIRARRRLMTE